MKYTQLRPDKKFLLVVYNKYVLFTFLCWCVVGVLFEPGLKILSSVLLSRPEMN